MADDDDVGEQPLGILGVLSLLWRHGQSLLVYPAASAFQNSKPPRIQTPAMIGIQYMAPFLRTPDGIDLSCYLLPQTRATLSMDHHERHHYHHHRSSNSQPVEDVRVELTPAASEAQATVIVFHGNATHHWEDMQTAKDLFVMRCNVFLLSYRGYSLSSGSPNEKGLRVDAQTALDYILGQPYLSKIPIVLYGHSLGGAVAVDLASRNPSKISSLILSNTFTSLPDIVRRWPVIGTFSFVCHEKWDSAKKMRLIPSETPILILSGRMDEVVHPELVDKLWEAAQRRKPGTREVEVKRKETPKQSEGEKKEAGQQNCSQSSLSIFTSRMWPKKKSGVQPHVPPAYDVFVKIEGGTHNQTLNFPEYWVAIDSFIRSSTSTRKQVKQSESRGHHPSIIVSSPRSDAQSLPDRRWRYVNREIVVSDDDMFS